MTFPPNNQTALGGLSSKDYTPPSKLLFEPWKHFKYIFLNYYWQTGAYPIWTAEQEGWPQTKVCGNQGGDTAPGTHGPPQ